MFRIHIGNGKFMFVDLVKATSQFPDEVQIFTGFGDGSQMQDIACIRQHYEYKNGEVKKSNDSVDVLVWTDKTDEDYTEKFVIDLINCEEGE